MLIARGPDRLVDLRLRGEPPGRSCGGTRSGTSSHGASSCSTRRAGRRRIGRRGSTGPRAILASYGVESPGDWTAGTLVRRLPPAERIAMREEMSELMLLFARARVADVARGKSEPARRSHHGVGRGPARPGRGDRPPALFRTVRDPGPLPQGPGRIGSRGRGPRTTPGRCPRRRPAIITCAGTARAAEGDLDGAESDLGRAVALDPRRFWAWFVRACAITTGAATPRPWATSTPAPSSPPTSPGPT